jgi:hypothetical protein
MMAKKELYPFVEAVWDDAASHDETWIKPEELSGPERVVTRGWLVREDDKAIYIAGSIAFEGTKDDTVGNTMMIPKGMIVTRSTLKLSRPRERE